VPSPEGRRCEQSRLALGFPPPPVPSSPESRAAARVAWFFVAVFHLCSRLLSEGTAPPQPFAELSLLLQFSLSRSGFLSRKSALGFICHLHSAPRLAFRPPSRNRGAAASVLLFPVKTRRRVRSCSAALFSRFLPEAPHRRVSIPCARARAPGSRNRAAGRVPGSAPPRVHRHPSPTLSPDFCCARVRVALSRRRPHLPSKSRRKELGSHCRSQALLRRAVVCVKRGAAVI
jgi:hypothetical protein